MQVKDSSKAVAIARMIYLIICIFAGATLFHYTLGQSMGIGFIWIGILIGLAVGGLFIYVDSLMKQFTLRGFSFATFGLLIGLFCAWLLSTVNLPELLTTGLVGIQDIATKDNKETTYNLEKMTPFIQLGFNIFIYASLGFLGTVLALRTSQDEFAFIIPYIRFREESLRGKPSVCSSDIITDGRLPQLLETGFINRRLVIPSFVVEELQNMTSSESPTLKKQGEKGIKCLNTLRDNVNNQVTIHEVPTKGTQESMNNELLQICGILKTRLITTDNTLEQVAQLQGIDTLNLNSLNAALKHSIDIGQRMQLAIVKSGKEEHQGVGFLSDGTLIVVNKAVEHIGSILDITVISSIQTSAGIMVFAEITDNLQE